jgi:hypothetical protein
MQLLINLNQAKSTNFKSKIPIGRPIFHEFVNNKTEQNLFKIHHGRGKKLLGLLITVLATIKDILLYDFKLLLRLLK